MIFFLQFEDCLVFSHCRRKIESSTIFTTGFKRHVFLKVIFFDMGLPLPSSLRHPFFQIGFFKGRAL
jgi:hypothetical protein